MQHVKTLSEKRINTLEDFFDMLDELDHLYANLICSDINNDDYTIVEHNYQEIKDIIQKYIKDYEVKENDII